MSFVPLPRLVFPTLDPLFRHHEGAVDEAFREINPSRFFQVPRQAFQDLSHHAGLDPAGKSSETGASGRKAVRQIRPGSAGTQDPENAVEYRTVAVQLWSSASVCTSYRSRN